MKAARGRHETLRHGREVVNATFLFRRHYFLAVAPRSHRVSFESHLNLKYCSNRGCQAQMHLLHVVVAPSPCPDARDNVRHVVRLSHESVLGQRMGMYVFDLTNSARCMMRRLYRVFDQLTSFIGLTKADRNTASRARETRAQTIVIWQTS